jgi:hypothetical protein
MEKNVQTRIFIGCLVTSEVRMHLKSSHPWQLAQIDPQSSPLIETHYHNQTYVGRFLGHPFVSLQELKQHQEEVIAHLAEFCPALTSAPLKIQIFPQTFIR